MVIRSRLPREENKRGIGSKFLSGMSRLAKGYYDSIPLPDKFEKTGKKP